MHVLVIGEGVLYKILLLIMNIPEIQLTKSSGLIVFPGLATTKALGSSPATSSLMPTTAASATSSFVAKRPSSSAGATWKI